MASFNQSTSNPQSASADFLNTQFSLGSAISNAVIISTYLQDRYDGSPLTMVSAMGVTGDFPSTTQPSPTMGQIWPRGLC
jgi:hypothetical protein